MAACARRSQPNVVAECAVLSWLGTRRCSDDGREGSVVGCTEHDGVGPLLRAAAAGYCFSHWLCAPRLPRRQFLRPVALYGMHSNFEKLPLCSDGGTFASDTIRRCTEQWDTHEDLRISLGDESGISSSAAAPVHRAMKTGRVARTIGSQKNTRTVLLFRKPARQFGGTV